MKYIYSSCVSKVSIRVFKVSTRVSKVHMDLVLIYGNILKMLKNYWNVSLKKTYDENEFKNEIYKNGYIYLYGIRTIDDIESSLHIFITSNPDFHTKKGNFDKLISIMNKTNTENTTGKTTTKSNIKKEKPSMEVNMIIIAPEIITASHILKQIVVLKEQQNINVKTFNYKYFIMELPKRIGIPKHEIVTKNSNNDYQIIHKDENDLRYITIMDPMAIWIGAQIGDIVRVTRMSETAGTEITYNKVVA